MNGHEPGRRSRRRMGCRRGFSLVEMIAAMAVIAALGAVSATLIFTAVRSYTDAAVGAQLHAEASTALDRLTRALWSINRDASASVVAPQVSSVSGTSLAFNGNWALTLSGSQITLAEDGGAAVPVLKDVSALSIAVYDESNNALSLPRSGAATQEIRRIELQFTIKRNAVTETVRTRVFIRSCMVGAAVG